MIEIVLIFVLRFAHVLNFLLFVVASRLMSAEEAGKLRPVDQVSGEQREAAQRFLCVLREHLESLCADLRTHAITDVRTKDKVCVAFLSGALAPICFVL